MSLTYQEALDYLYGLINYEIQRPSRYTPDVVSLDRPRALLAALGNPQETYPTLHLTGTKGKGSVSAMCASVLQAAGLRVGLYSSPHLQDFRERFRINNEMIAPEVLASLVERVQHAVAQIDGLTWFEVVTALAFMAFAEHKVDVAVIEVGLGGRLDATNILKAPLATAITSLSYDHMNLLGNTLSEIAYEKAGILKPNVPAVTAPQEDPPLAVIRQIAAERNSPLTVVGEDVHFGIGHADEFGQTFTYQRDSEPAQSYWTPLIGAHQAVNGAVALTLMHTLREAGYPISERAMQNGLAQVNWAGRLEVIRRAPHYLILDSAHNAASAERLRDALHVFGQRGRRLILLFGAFSDKDVRGMFRALLPEATHLVLMQAMSPRAFNTEQLTALAEESGFNGSIHTFPSAQEAIYHAESLADIGDVICATGSLSVVGELRSVLGLTPGRAAYLDEQTVQLLQSKI